ncbi:hypothetical protein [Primorskyibacter sp. S187A]|uniref:hypothetical protein n=1 Tax=Primorskyibacter sp. S187A TaxID=3415130 RepID=UPI003C7DEBE1
MRHTHPAAHFAEDDRVIILAKAAQCKTPSCHDAKQSGSLPSILKRYLNEQYSDALDEHERDAAIRLAQALGAA